MWVLKRWFTWWFRFIPPMAYRWPSTTYHQNYLFHTLVESRCSCATDIKHSLRYVQNSSLIVTWSICCHLLALRSYRNTSLIRFPSVPPITYKSTLLYKTMWDLFYKSYDEEGHITVDEQHALLGVGRGSVRWYLLRICMIYVLNSTD